MAVNDLTNKQQMIKDYLVELLRANFPNIDLGESSAFMELFGLTHLKLLEPLLDFADRLTLMQSMDNAEYLSEEEMDQLAAKEYFERKAGERATGDVTLVFRDIPSTRTIQLPAGLVTTSRQGLRFISINSVFIDEAQLANYYDPESFQFRIPMAFIAEYAGDEYNVAASDVKDLETTLPYLEYIYNEAPFTGGTNRETNRELANRITEGYQSPNLGTEKGYIRFIKENVAEVTEVLVVGYGHPLMMRDIIGTIPADAFNQTVRDVHWGSKIDLYLRGNNLLTTTVTTEVALLPFEVGDLGIQLFEVPVHDIQFLTIVNNNPNVDQTQLAITDYALVFGSDTQMHGTAYETAFIRIYDERVQEGTPVRVTYRYDSIPSDVTNLLYNEDYRPPTADVLIKQAIPKYVVGSVVAKPSLHVRMLDSDRSVGRQNAYTHINGLKMGGELQFSDLNDAILHGDPANEVFDYLKLPSQFLLFHQQNQFAFDSLSTLQQQKLEQIALANSYMGSIVNGYQTNVSVYELLDMFYLLSSDQNIEAGLQALIASSTEGEERANMIRYARELYLRGNAASWLMPVTMNAAENEYFELSQLNFYEYRPYTNNEWDSLFTVWQNYANAREDSTILDVTVYALSVLYVCTQVDKLASSVAPFYAYMQGITRGTPIQDRFYI